MGSWIKTILLLGVLSALLVLIGGYLGGQQGAMYALIFAILMNGASYFFSEKIALAASGAKPLSKDQAPEVYAIVEDLAHKYQMPMPKMYITPASQANAFATGRGPGHASVAVTQGIMRTLDKEELRGVLAHELAHVKNRDVLIATIAAVLASALAYIAQMAMWGGFGGNDRERNSNGIIMLIGIIVVPIAATLLQLAVSRQREYAADATGAHIIGDGRPLAEALLDIESTTKQLPMQTNPAFSSLYIENPLGGLGGGLMGLFSTHPPTKERVERLRKIHS